MAAKDALFDPARNPLFRENYRPLDYKIPTANLHFNMDDKETTVTNTFTITKNRDNAKAGGPLILDGEDLKLMSLRISDDNGQFRDMDPSEYFVTDKNLIIKTPPSGDFQLEIVTEINPEENTSLSGLYTAGDILTTQCEAQGFRRISYFLDRPDNMTVFTTTLEADKAKYPTLLSNGNGDYKASTDLGNGRHSVTWQDPWPKPSYLFAAVAGDLLVLEDTFTTMSGKNVDLRIFVQPGYEDKITWAMQSIKRSMKWDETRYGREYDLDCFHIVAVDKFNAGAMENKGLNIFNVKYLVGTPEISTDAQLTAIEAVIAHEYFHNYSGDRVTVRDWFELTLKEGLTVLRDRQFTEDTHSKSIKQLEDAIDLRSIQFMEDAGPTSHPIRPDRVEEFDNIYTGTIYEKGSHVLGMLHTMMGEKTWRAAMDEYFSRFDSQAVTCDDFVNVMEEVSGIDLAQFRKWYSQSGTPEVSYSGVYDAASRTYTLTLTQLTKPTADQTVKEALHIPVAVGLIGQSGKDIPLKTSSDADAPTTRILHLTEASQSFTFTDVSGPVVPSVLRGFSAPVKVTTAPTQDELLFRMTHDSDSYNRYEATERLMVQTLHSLIADSSAGRPLTLPNDFLAAYGNNVANALDGDLAYNALLLQLPPYNIIIQDLPSLDPDAVNDAIDYLSSTLADRFAVEFNEIYKMTAAPAGEAYDVVPGQVGRRSLHNTALMYMTRMSLPQTDIAVQQYKSSQNMTEKMAALANLSAIESAEKEAQAALDDFYNTYKHDNNLVDRWLSLNASMPNDNALQHVKSLMQHEAYDATNPNKVRALVGGFVANNPTHFHAADGSGYKFLADTIIAMNDINAKTGTSLANYGFSNFKRYDADRQALMVAEMERIMAVPTLDVGLKEIVGKALQTATRKPGNDNRPGNSFGNAAAK